MSLPFTDAEHSSSSPKDDTTLPCTSNRAAVRVSRPSGDLGGILRRIDASRAMIQIAMGRPHAPQQRSPWNTQKGLLETVWKVFDECERCVRVAAVDRRQSNFVISLSFSAFVRSEPTVAATDRADASMHR